MKFILFYFNFPLKKANFVDMQTRYVLKVRALNLCSLILFE